MCGGGGGIGKILTGGLTTNVTDTLGLTDTNAAARAADQVSAQKKTRKKMLQQNDTSTGIQALQNRQSSRASSFLSPGSSYQPGSKATLSGNA